MRLASSLCHITLGKRAPGTDGIGVWAGPRASLDDMEKLSVNINHTASERKQAYERSTEIVMLINLITTEC
jgi:hypothetical protein